MLIIDGEKFKVDVLSCKRTADFLDKHAKRTENGDLKRELIGVYFNYKLTIAPGIDRAEYSRFWDKIHRAGGVPHGHGPGHGRRLYLYGVFLQYRR